MITLVHAVSGMRWAMLHGSIAMWVEEAGWPFGILPWLEVSSQALHVGLPLVHICHPWTEGESNKHCLSRCPFPNEIACVVFNISCPSALVVSSGPVWKAPSHYLGTDLTMQSPSQRCRDVLGFPNTQTPGSINRNVAFIVDLMCMGKLAQRHKSLPLPIHWTLGP